MLYQILSPDGFAIMVHGEMNFRSIKSSREALKKWVEGFRTQGHYSQICYNGYNRRISLQELPDYCEIIKIN